VFDAILRLCTLDGWDVIDGLLPLLPTLALEENGKKRTLFLEAITQKHPAAHKLFKRYQDHAFIYAKDSDGNNALNIACMFGYDEMIPELMTVFDLETGVNIHGQNAVQLAIEHGHTACLKAIARLRDLSATLPQDLRLAVSRGRKECFEVLRAYMESTHIENNGKSTALANFFHHRDEQGNTLLHLTAANNAGMCDYLLTHYHPYFEPLLHAANKVGELPLHIACRHGNEQNIRLFERFGAKFDVQIKSSGNEKPKDCIHLILEAELPNTLQLLDALGARFEKQYRHDYLAVLHNKTSNAATRCRALINLYTDGQARAERSPPNYILRPPENLVIRGGGPRGFSYLGLLSAFENAASEDAKLLRNVQRVAGTSAGAITAALLAVGYPISEIENRLNRKQFSEFLEFKDNQSKHMMAIGTAKSTWEKVFAAFKAYWNGGAALNDPVKQAKDMYSKIVDLPGLCNGDNFETWIEGLIKERIGKDKCTFGELEELRKSRPELNIKALHVFATHFLPVDGSTAFTPEQFSAETHRELIISSAIRASMSIPGVFTPHRLRYKGPRGEYHVQNEGVFVDGGLLKNFPLTVFDLQKYQGRDTWAESTNPRTLGIGLKAADEPLVQHQSPGITDVVQTYLNFEDTLLHNNPRQAERVVEVATSGVGLLDFDLSPEQKKELMAAGEKAAEEFIAKQRAAANK